jgi:F-type H+-transporting ATPase subunit delta
VSRRIARPYAAALFQVVGKRNLAALRGAEEQLGTVAELFHRRPELLRAFEVPSIAPAVKAKLLAALSDAAGLSVEVRRLLAALEQHFRLRALPEVVAAFRDLVDRREGVKRARVELPVAATPTQTKALEEALATALHARVELEAVVTPELLAGFVVRIGSQVFDGSLRRQLARFAARRD